MKASYIAFDTETGGLNEKVNPILTAYLCAVSDKLDVIDEIYLKIKPSAPYDQVDAGALKVNKIDISKHIEDPETLTREEASKKIVEFLSRYSPNSARSKDRPRPLGHNITFDIKMLQEQLIPFNEWEKHFHYHGVDTMPITQFLKDAGWLPPELGKLESLVKHFNVSQREAHNAKGDVLMTIDVYKGLMSLLQNNKPGANAAPAMDLLSMLEK